MPLLLQSLNPIWRFQARGPLTPPHQDPLPPLFKNLRELLTLPHPFKVLLKPNSYKKEVGDKPKVLEGEEVVLGTITDPNEVVLGVVEEVTTRATETRTLGNSKGDKGLTNSNRNGRN